MSSSHDNSKCQQTALKAFAESENTSDSNTDDDDDDDDGLDIVKTSRRNLDLMQHIESGQQPSISVHRYSNAF